MQTLAKVEDHVKNYRPKLLVLSGVPSNRPCLVDFANLLTKRLSLLQFTNIVIDATNDSNNSDNSENKTGVCIIEGHEICSCI